MSVISQIFLISILMQLTVIIVGVNQTQTQDDPNTVSANQHAAGKNILHNITFIRDHDKLKTQAQKSPNTVSANQHAAGKNILHNITFIRDYDKSNTRTQDNPKPVSANQHAATENILNNVEFIRDDNKFKKDANKRQERRDLAGLIKRMNQANNTDQQND